MDLKHLHWSVLKMQPVRARVCTYRYNQRMDEIRQFMITKSVPTPMRRRMIAFFNTLWSENAIYDEAEIISLLSPSM